MLRPHGEIHVSHKTTAPFCDWGIEQLAASFSLGLIDSAVFNIADYPGYHNKRGDGERCDMPFPIGKSSTYKFTITEPKKKRKKKRRNKSHSNSCGEPNEQALFEASKKRQWIPLGKEEVRINGTHYNTCDESGKQVLETSQEEPRIDLVDKRVDSQGLRNDWENERMCDEADKQLVFEYFGERQRLPLDEERKSASNKVLHFTSFGELPDKLAFEFARERTGGVVNQAGNPGYSNERGGGQRCDEQFAVVKSRTCNFTIGDLLKDMIGNTSVNGQVFGSFKFREMMHLHQPSSDISVPLAAQCLLIRDGLMNREHPIGGRSQGSVNIQCPEPGLRYHVCNESRGIFMGDRSRHYESILRRGSFRELMLWSLDCKSERLLTLSGI